MRKIIYSKALINLISGCIFDGLTDEETAILSGVNRKTIYRIRLGDECPIIKAATIERMRHYIQAIRDGNDRSNHWQRIAWFLERRYPDRWAKPEVLLNVNASSTTNNTLVITAEAAAGLRSRSNAMEAELAKLTPKSSKNAQVSDKLGLAPEGAERLAKAYEEKGPDGSINTHPGQDPSLIVESVKPKSVSSVKKGEAAHSPPPTTARHADPVEPPLPGKSKILEVSSNSDSEPRLPGKSQISESSSNSKVEPRLPRNSGKLKSSSNSKAGQMPVSAGKKEPADRPRARVRSRARSCRGS